MRGTQGILPPTERNKHCGRFGFPKAFSGAVPYRDESEWTAL